MILEQCCREKRVPPRCMGLCKEEKDASQYRFMSICDRYESVIQQCTGENQEGNLDIEYVTIRCNAMSNIVGCLYYLDIFHTFLSRSNDKTDGSTDETATDETATDETGADETGTDGSCT